MPIWLSPRKKHHLHRSVAGASLGLFALLGLSGCYSPPSSRQALLEAEVPDAWSVELEGTSEFNAGSWVDDFNDPRLEAILKEALAYNYDLREASARLDAALATSKSNRADIFPALTVGGTGTKSRRGSASGIDQTPTSETYGLNGRLAWEIDLWGKVRNGYRGDLADQAAAIADYQAARLSLAAQVAKAWYAAVEANQQYELEVRILEALSESSRIVEENFTSGIAGALDVRLIRANLASSKSSLEGRRRSRDAAIRTLEVLLGRYPRNEIDVVSDFPTLDAEIPVGLPSDLLLRRPDIISAERTLAAVEQRKFETSKARLPSIDLTLSRGTSAADVGDIFELTENRIWTQSLSIAQTLFNAGRLKANYKRAVANYELNVAAYANTVLTAFREVESELYNQESYAADYEFLKVAATESMDAETLAWEEYSSGLSDITTVLDSVQRSINAQRSLIQVANNRVQSRIDLYLALGGGFEI
ncbi:efflux transporter outer membrane subunit [Pelagicoccus albus]|uniref:Efflux transporter outer membrane subunit n=1 Tax=Pelagicoccus albus TaxID=415222 RepID=A0A7X1B4A2_9BACT|nr:efflux transporter outer membrane subunit [Pelagicoccus albus]MBC2605350.1 efflux transporter outer membrane subunit [Pelagicoccus albus]